MNQDCNLDEIKLPFGNDYYSDISSGQKIMTDGDKNHKPQNFKYIGNKSTTKSTTNEIIEKDELKNNIKKCNEQNIEEPNFSYFNDNQNFRTNQRKDEKQFLSESSVSINLKLKITYYENKLKALYDLFEEESLSDNYNILEEIKKLHSEIQDFFNSIQTENKNCNRIDFSSITDIGDNNGENKNSKKLKHYQDNKKAVDNLDSKILKKTIFISKKRNKPEKAFNNEIQKEKEKEKERDIKEDYLNKDIKYKKDKDEKQIINNNTIQEMKNTKDSRTKKGRRPNNSKTEKDGSEIYHDRNSKDNGVNKIFHKSLESIFNSILILMKKIDGNIKILKPCVNYESIKNNTQKENYLSRTIKENICYFKTRNPKANLEENTKKIEAILSADIPGKEKEKKILNFLFKMIHSEIVEMYLYDKHFILIEENGGNKIKYNLEEFRTFSEDFSDYDQATREEFIKETVKLIKKQSSKRRSRA